MLDKVFLVNLPHSRRRRAHMESQRRRVHLPEFEVHGISGHTLSEAQKEELNRDRLAFYREEFGRDATPLTRGQLGCYLTHFEILHAIVEDGHELCLVFEDDIIFKDDFARWQGYLRQLETLDPGWDLVYLNCVPNRWQEFEWVRELFPDPFLDQPTPQPNVVQSGFSFGTSSMLISGRGARKLLALERPLLEPVDLQFQLGHSTRPCYARFPRIRAYAFHPCLTTELTGQISLTQSYP